MSYSPNIGEIIGLRENQTPEPSSNGQSPDEAQMVVVVSFEAPLHFL